MSDCLNDSDLEQFHASESITESRSDLIRKHLAVCPECALRDAQFLSEQEKMLRDLRLVAVAEAASLGSDQAAPTLIAPPPAPASDSFSGYEILREIHRGGQGIVYQAVQKSTKRKVAIKVMKEGPFASAADKARFEREVLVLGQLNHPNIVGVHDSGQAAGHFYFVMDYISGESLDAHISAHERPIEDSLELFAKICEAVNAAHLRGVIHRDLKPGNIRIDDEGQPHILDFGLARTGTTDAQAAAMTMTGQFIGSLPWASPEQAEAIPHKIDMRTDVYSLGVILYQMLTGRFPYDVIGNMRDVLDRIMKAEPARPSSIRRQINDEVDTIVLKCLSKERERRYQTAGELARDIRHYLRGEPIEARRDSNTYMLRKFISRNYRSLSAVFLVMLFIAGSYALHQRSVSRLLAATSSFYDANEFYRAGSYKDALTAINTCISLDSSRIDAPILKAKILISIGNRAEATNVLETISATHPPTSVVHGMLADLLKEVNSEKASQHLREARGLSINTADAYYLQAVAEDDSTRAIQHLTKAIEQNPGHFESLMLRAFLYYGLGNFEKMLSDCLNASALRPNDFTARVNLGVAYVGLSKFDEAAAALSKARLLQPDDPRPVQYLATLAERRVDWQQVIQLYESLERNHPGDPNSVLQLGKAYACIGQWKLAISSFAEASKRNPQDLIAEHYLAWLYLVAPIGDGRDPGKGLAKVMQIKRLDPATQGIDITLALANMRASNTNEALHWASIAEKRGDLQPADLFVIAMCYYLGDQHARARAVYTRAVEQIGLASATCDADVKLLQKEAEILILLAEQPR